MLQSFDEGPIQNGSAVYQYLDTTPPAIATASVGAALVVTGGVWLYLRHRNRKRHRDPTGARATLPTIDIGAGHAMLGIGGEF